MKVLIKKGNVGGFTRTPLIFLVQKQGEARRQSDPESRFVNLKSKHLEESEKQKNSRSLEMFKTFREEMLTYPTKSDLC
jgi:hypothetical protein